MEIALLYLIPIFTGCLCLIPTSPLWQGRIQSIGMICLLTDVWLLIHQINQSNVLHALGDLISLDALSGFMLVLISLVGLLTSIYSIDYMATEAEERFRNPWKLKSYYVLFNLFLLSMILMVTTN